MESDVLVELRGIGKRFADGAGPVLEGIDLVIRAGEFVALLGPSGCGKSTLLRIAMGLLAPTAGSVLYKGQHLRGPNPKAAMVFQSSALYPWLTVEQNVELALRTQGVPTAERTARAERLIRLIGLDGYENAFPRELSGGMRQRVAFARALAMEPELLCMDEPFSTLDPLTAGNLRDELLGFWLGGHVGLKGILMVTHGIEEAVYMADRIVVLSRHPARVAADIPVALSHPRDRRSPAFNALSDQIYTQITGTVGTAAAPAPPPPAPPSPQFRRLPHAAPSMLTGLLEVVEDHGGQDDLFDLGGHLLLKVADLLALTEAAELLGFATISDGDLTLTSLGRQFVEARAEQRKALFFQQIRWLPVFDMTASVLRAKRNLRMDQEYFAELLDEQFGPDEAPAQLRTLIGWGRYAGLFHYDARTETLYLDDGDRGLQEA
jgi:NitT/TauT family transport system ATP-binding protein